MPAEFFVDTSAWYPALVRNHPQHDVLAASLRERVSQGQRVVTTNLVVAETHALLLHRVGRDPALNFVRTVHEPPILVVESNRDLEERAIALYLDRYRDQSFSLTDGVSFAVMKERRITDALTLDRHFVAAGFRIHVAAQRQEL
ncbi:MAG: PIN domain-containing protein [Gemmatimonadaceae bacterium]